MTNFEMEMFQRFTAKGTKITNSTLKQNILKLEWIYQLECDGIQFYYLYRFCDNVKYYNFGFLFLKIKIRVLLSPEHQANIKPNKNVGKP